MGAFARIGLLLAMMLDPAPAEPAGPGLDAGEALARYNELREKTPKTAAAQWKLAAWCEQNGLPGEAFAHYATVVRLNPARDAAWKKLGYRKHGGRWMTDEQVADEAVQKEADKVWGAKLKKIHKDVHGGKKQAEAREELSRVEDPRAVPSVYREFAAGGAADQVIAVQVLGQIDSPDASKVLAIMAVYGKSPEVRRRATETLRHRKADEYLALLVNLLADPIKYEVRPVGGPGSPGVLVVEGQRFDIRRFYAPPAPNFRVRPGDMVVGYDGYGLPIIGRPLGVLHKAGVPGSKTLVNEDIGVMEFSYRQALVQAQQGAVNAQLLLQRDVAQIDGLNAARKSFNDIVLSVARDATGKDVGDDPADWRKVAAVGGGQSQDPPSKKRKPTIDQVVPLASMPQFGQLAFIRRVVTDS